MDNLLMIATLIERLSYSELKTMADLLCTQMKDEPKTNWPKDTQAMAGLIYDWATCQIEAADDDK